jgi:formylglycine-generating enzyme required for sulfatase activity
LPTEAEWEYACRAGSDTAFAYGNKLTALQARFCERVLSTPQPTMPVGMFPPNNWGLHDMHGNVWEWCSDWYQLDYYSKSPKADPKGPAKGAYHVLRGGSASVKAFECRSAIRGESMMDKPYSNSNVRFEAIGDFGLRVVCELRK